MTVVRGEEAPPIQHGEDPFPKDASQVLGTVPLSGSSRPQVSVKGKLELDPGDNYLLSLIHILVT